MLTISADEVEEHLKQGLLRAPHRARGSTQAQRSTRNSLQPANNRSRSSRPDFLEHDHLARLCTKLGAIAKVIDGTARNDSCTIGHRRCNDCSNVSVVDDCCHGFVGGRDGNKEGNHHHLHRHLLQSVRHQKGHPLKKVTVQVYFQHFSDREFNSFSESSS